MQPAPIEKLRALGRRVLPQGRLRRLGNSLLHAFEWRRGTLHTIAGQRLRLLPGSLPSPSDSNDIVATLDALQLRRFAEALRPGDVVADVGAYRGAYAVLAALLVGDRGHVYAFEPVLANVKIVRRNLDLNGIAARVTIIARAAAAETGTVTFYAAGTSSANSLLRAAIEPLAPDHVQSTQVHTCTLDEELSARGVQPNVVKIDVEGAELAVLRGADAIVRSDAQIFCELHPYAWPEAGHTGEELRAWLHERRRVIRDLESDAEVTTWRYGPVSMQPVSAAARE